MLLFKLSLDKLSQTATISFYMDDLLSWLDQGATIITPTTRLAQEIHHFYLQSWSKPRPAPTCVSYTTFIRDIYHTHYTAQNKACFYVLSAHHRRFIWRNILQKSIPQNLNVSLIKEIDETWRHAQQWLIDFNHPDFLLTTQTAQYQQWVQAFTHQLHQINALTFEQMIEHVLAIQNPRLPKQLIWYGFDELTPLQTLLHQFLLKHHTYSWQATPPASQSSTWQCMTKDEYTEREALLVWLKDLRHQGIQPINVVIPDLTQQFAGLKRWFSQHFKEAEFTFFRAQPLDTYPLVAHALHYLKLSKHTLSHHKVNLLVSSPYIKHADVEFLARAEFLQHHALMESPFISFVHLVQELTMHAPLLAEVLQNLTAYPAYASINEWVTLFLERLEQLGFPGEQAFSSVQYQIYQRLQTVFNEFQSLHFLTSKLSFKEAIATLENLIQTTLFQPQTLQTPIQIMSLSEANNGFGQAMWVMNMTDDNVPRKLKPLTFIPFSLQKKYGMPYALIEQELIQAQNMLKRFASFNQQCVFSYAKLTAEKLNLPSPLIRHLPNFIPKPGHKSLQPALETYQETYQYPLTDQKTTKGGTRLLANQAMCPFKAFAAHRLHLSKPKPPIDGLSFAKRGQLMHKAMELIWRTLPNQAALNALSASAITALITQIIERVLAPFKAQKILTDTLYEVEAARLSRLMHAAIIWEKTRPPFKIKALEAQSVIDVGALQLNVRLDRLDVCLTTGKYLIIDYKSTLPTTMPWREIRPKEPQLLLYALLDNRIETLLFAELNAGSFTPKGLCNHGNIDTDITSIKKDENWANLRDTWQQSLTKLAHEFKAGVCRPEPTQSTLCQSCEFKSLCRITT